MCKSALRVLVIRGGAVTSSTYSAREKLLAAERFGARCAGNPSCTCELRVRGKAWFGPKKVPGWSPVSWEGALVSAAFIVLTLAASSGRARAHRQNKQPTTYLKFVGAKLRRAYVTNVNESPGSSRELIEVSPIR